MVRAICLSKGLRRVGTVSLATRDGTRGNGISGSNLLSKNTAELQIRTHLTVSTNFYEGKDGQQRQYLAGHCLASILLNPPGARIDRPV